MSYRNIPEINHLMELDPTHLLGEYNKDFCVNCGCEIPPDLTEGHCKDWFGCVNQIQWPVYEEAKGG